MKLLDKIREDRFRQKARQPLPETAAGVVATIVQKYGLLNMSEEWGKRRITPPGVEPAGRLSLFPLATAAQWQLTKEILARYDNPYLVFARSPEEIILSRRLYERHPGLAAEVLREQSLGALWEKEIFEELERR
jgi:hypothetical protein